MSILNKVLYKIKISLYKKWCSKENSEKCYQLGEIYEEGIATKQDYVKAVKYYQKVSDGSNIDACFNLGIMYEEGNGVQKDISKALELYAQSLKVYNDLATKNDSNALYRLGKIYEEGRGVEKDLEKAVSFYQKSSHPKAMYNLAVIYDKKLYVDKDAKEAIYFYKKSAKKGCLNAQRKLASYFIDKQEYSKAKYWYSKLDKHGDPFAQRNIDFIHKKEKIDSFDKQEKVSSFNLTEMWFSFKGTIGVAQFVLFMIPLLFLVDSGQILITILLTWMSLALIIKRLRDTNSTIFMFIVLILIFILIFPFLYNFNFIILEEIRQILFILGILTLMVLFMPRKDKNVIKGIVIFSLIFLSILFVLDSQGIRINEDVIQSYIENFKNMLPSYLR